MDNQEYLDYYKQAFEKIFINEGDYVYIKDSDFKYVMVSPSLKTMMGISEKIVSNTILEVANKSNIAPAIVDEIHIQDIKIKQKLTELTCLEIMKYEDEHRIVIVHKTPIINPHTKDFVGIRGQVGNFIWPNLIKTLFKIQGVKGTLLDKHSSANNMIEKYPLNPVQHIVLFLAMHNYSYSDISIIMNSLELKISTARVSDHLEKLKIIFNVRTKSQLIEKAIGFNFHALLPEALFNKASSIEVTQQAVKIYGLTSNGKIEKINKFA